MESNLAEEIAQKKSELESLRTELLKLEVTKQEIQAIFHRHEGILNYLLARQAMMENSSEKGKTE
jgi:hypothetical protein